ncbi:hypothetical protein MBLNU459_g6894t1 [Dothideomycetes sp. NU459]
MAEEIPHPAGLPIIGNLRDIDPELPMQSLSQLAERFGPIYSLTTFGQRRIIISSVALMNEICDEKRFTKSLAAALNEVRNGTHDGLFTARPGEHNWELAHRVLVPAFGPLNIRAMFPEMKDIASQLVMKWARHGSEFKIPVTDDFTRLTLDTLALCSMDYRFNSFYQEQMHPFIDSMVNFLSESGSRPRRPYLLSPLFRNQEYQYWKDIDYMRKLSMELVQNRKRHPEEDRKDLLNAMLYGKDARSGEKLSEESIVDNMITFLIAGHETTSGLLSFTFYHLLKNPSAYRKAQEEVDRVIGRGSIEVEHMSKLPYLTAILRETLRLNPTAPAISFGPINDIETLGGKYTVYKDQPIVALLGDLQRDPAVYGADAQEWKPERMTDENFNKLPPNAWKPFGNGQRACIGRPFAWQESLLVIAIVLQKFDLFLDDAQYQLRFKQTLTIKPKDFYMRASLRNGISATQLERSLASGMSESAQENHAKIRGDGFQTAQTPGQQGQPLTILYGSNTGTCQAFAQSLAADAVGHGFSVTKVDTLDSATGSLPTDQPVAIVTASYEGAPCDNAARFFNWLDSLKEGESTKISYAVFGAGHSDWKSTFHRIPTAIDDILAANQGERICERGAADAAHGDMFSDFETWADQVFWPAMSEKYSNETAMSDNISTTQSVSVEVSNVRSSHLRADVSEARVIDSKLLSKEQPEKRHIEIQLPSDMTYSSGDYLAILPLNPQESVQRVMRRFNLAWDSMLTINATTGTTLPTGVPISAHDVFSAYVELSQPATKRNMTMLADACTDEHTKTQLTQLTDKFSAEVSEKRVSLLDLLCRFESIQLPLGNFIASLPPMRTRSYSISSSSLWNPKHVTLTYNVLHTTHTSGAGEHVGVASNFLSKLAKGDTLHVSVRPSNQNFHLPTDSENTPVLMACAGTGLAPFRGFVQERAAQVGSGRKLAPAILIIGCRSPDNDELYREEFDKWEAMGAVKVLRAYSRAPEASEGHKYAQETLYAHKDEILELWDKGSKAYVCGSRNLEQSIRETCQRIYLERAKERGKDKTEKDAVEWFESIRNARFATDVFT